MLWFVPMASAADAVPTQHIDNQRTGAVTTETALTPATVSGGAFGLQRILPVDGQIYAEPLYVPNVAVSRKSHRDLVLVATEHDSVYAFDANAGGRAVWKRSFLKARGVTVTTVPGTDYQCDDIDPEVGITGTPAIDLATNTLYVVAATKEGGQYVQRLHALDVATGAERPGSPRVISASLPGTGGGSSGGNIAFDPFLENQRQGLLVANGSVYVAWGSHCDQGAFHGWLMRFDETSLALQNAWLSTPDGTFAGLWASGSGIAADTAGNLFVSTGNGTFDASTGGRDYGDSVVRLGPSFAVGSSFTPYNQDTLRRQDLDLASGGVLLLPNQSGTHPHLAVTGGKFGTVYLLDRDALGGYDPNGDHVVQEFAGDHGGLFGAPAWWNGHVYLCGAQDYLKSYAYDATTGLLGTTPSSQTGDWFNFPGPTPTISSNGNSDGIAWIIESDAASSGGPAILRAYDATDLTNELWSSDVDPADQAGPAVKFTVPTVAGGRVYVGADGELDVYGLN